MQRDAYAHADKSCPLPPIPLHYTVNPTLNPTLNPIPYTRNPIRNPISYILNPIQNPIHYILNPILNPIPYTLNPILNPIPHTLTLIISSPAQTRSKYQKQNKPRAPHFKPHDGFKAPPLQPLLLASHKGEGHFRQCN